MANRTIPLVDVSAGPGAMDAIRHVFENGGYIGGRDIQLFEEEWRDTVGAESCVATSSGTQALTILLESIKQKERQVVIIPAFSFVATRDAVIHAGLTPLICGVNDEGLLDPVKMESLLDNLRRKDELKNVLAVVPVHLYGQVADVNTIDRLCEDYRIPYLIEDACQAHGASYTDISPSTYELCYGGPVGSRFPAVWSFMPAKILGGCGDGGAITFPDKEWETEHAFVSAARNHGRTGHNTHIFPGYKARMDTLKAAFLRFKLKSFSYFLADRGLIACQYIDGLEDLKELHVPINYFGRVWSYFVVRLAEGETLHDANMCRKDLQDFLKQKGISTSIHYPYVFDQNGFEDPTSVKLATTSLTLPLYPGMSWEDANYIIAAIRDFFNAD